MNIKTEILLCTILFLCKRVLNSPYLASATNIGDGLIRAWELHRDAVSTRNSKITRFVIMFAGGEPSKGPEVGDGDFTTAAKSISLRMQQGNFSGSPSNLNVDSNSNFKEPIFVYTSSVSSQIHVPNGMTKQQAILQFETFLKFVKEFLNISKNLTNFLLFLVTTEILRRLSEESSCSHQHQDLRISTMSQQPFLKLCAQ